MTLSFWSDMSNRKLVKHLAWILCISLTPTFCWAQAGPLNDWEQAAGGKMSFEVVSIHLAKPGDFRPPSFPLSADDSYAANKGSFFADFPLAVYIAFAYKLQLTSQITAELSAHLPKWAFTDSYVIQARAPREATKDQMRLMMQALLAERFDFRTHFEAKTSPILALTMQKQDQLGPQLIPHQRGPRCDVSNPGATLFPESCDVFGSRTTNDHLLEIGARNTTLPLIADIFSTLSESSRTIIDRTGLQGRYDFKLSWTPDRNSPMAVSGGESDLQVLSFARAVRDQLGLKLEKGEAPINVLVVDHVDRPSEN